MSYFMMYFVSDDKNKGDQSIILTKGSPSTLNNAIVAGDPIIICWISMTMKKYTFYVLVRYWYICCVFCWISPAKNLSDMYMINANGLANQGSWEYTIILLNVWVFKAIPDHLRENLYFRTMVLAAIIMGTGLANERRRYMATPPLIGWTHIQNDPCT